LGGGSVLQRKRSVPFRSHPIEAVEKANSWPLKILNPCEKSEPLVGKKTGNGASRGGKTEVAGNSGRKRRSVTREKTLEVIPQGGRGHMVVYDGEKKGGEGGQEACR